MRQFQIFNNHTLKQKFFYRNFIIATKQKLNRAQHTTQQSTNYIVIKKEIS